MLLVQSVQGVFASVCLRACICVRVRSIAVLVSQLMSHGEGQRESRVFADAAAAVRLTHAGDVRQAQGLAGHVDGGADVLPAER